eukprot:3632164-Pleurochrysis_carterae.AAC.4
MGFLLASGSACSLGGTEGRVDARDSEGRVGGFWRGDQTEQSFSAWGGVGGSVRGRRSASLLGRNVARFCAP